MKTILEAMWTGLWQGIGVELSFFGLWTIWHLIHGKVAGKVPPESVLHKIHDYFTN